MSSEKKLRKVRERRQKRVRSSIFGTELRPRLSVHRSSKYVYVQAIADDIGRTLAEASAISSELKGKLVGLNKVDVAVEVGRLIGKKLLEQNVSEAVFDRGRYLYHGRVKAVAEGARDAGLKI
ncbi:MAG: 50S ribosomal protein L18 [Syntrophales bacterium]|nr:50S ribosomal protein L18 [Syntrophales bacterium]MDY0043165.1 50S ribosomal protein L18 [Syntrophales bacterium]